MYVLICEYTPLRGLTFDSLGSFQSFLFVLPIDPACGSLSAFIDGTKQNCFNSIEHYPALPEVSQEPEVWTFAIPMDQNSYLISVSIYKLNLKNATSAKDF